jgi:hypothetical protein
MVTRKLNRKLKRKQTKVKRAINKKKQTFKISKNFGVKRRSKKNLKLSRIQKNQLIGGGDEPKLVNRVREIFVSRRVKIPRDFARRVVLAGKAIDKIGQIEKSVNKLEPDSLHGYGVDDGEYFSVDDGENFSLADDAKYLLTNQTINQILGHFIDNFKPPLCLNQDNMSLVELVECVKEVLAKYREYKEIVKEKVVKLAEEISKKKIWSQVKKDIVDKHAERKRKDVNEALKEAVTKTVRDKAEEKGRLKSHEDQVKVEAEVDAAVEVAPTLGLKNGEEILRLGGKRKRRRTRRKK